jgi:predicted GTPase
MSLTNDYFLLYHGVNLEKDYNPEEINTKINDDAFSIFGLILSITKKHKTNFFTLDTFKKLCLKLNIDVPFNDDTLFKLQYSILNLIILHKSKSIIHTLNQSFQYLHKQNILSTENFVKLISLFEYKELNEPINDRKIKKVKSSFKVLKMGIVDILEELKYNVSNNMKNDISEIAQYLENQKFSIGITGVMNAGKSTMLNALMGKEILGSAVVPETANLTIVKYSVKEEAKVYYWNESEWNKIVQSSEILVSMKDFIKESNMIFGDSLKSYIKPTSRFDNIKINELSSYTSAEASGKKCNLVKYVELGSNLDFLKEGIEIVDTPGLDDPVIQREEITKEYLGVCDIMLHLMNVSQSATLKDIEFIIDALLYQNVSKLLIVITRADTVSKEQLNEVIEYTKTSIKRQLKFQNKDSKLDYILDTIQFIPISGKMALLHRTKRAKEAIDAGFTLEQTGILKIEEYLNETLFGSKSQKGEVVIHSAKKQLLRIVEKETRSLEYELKLLSKSQNELEKEMNNFNKKKDLNGRILTVMSEDILFYKNDSKDYIDSLESFLDTELIYLQNVIKQRVISDVQYSFEKLKKRPKSSRIKVIVETAIKDGIIDIIRDYRYKFIKKSQNISEQCEQKYHDLGFLMCSKITPFDAISFFQDDFKSGFLISSNDVLISHIIKAISKSKQSKLLELSGEIEIFIKDKFIYLEKDIKEKARKISVVLIDSFFNALNEPLFIFKEKLKNEEKILFDQISKYSTNEEVRAELSINIHKKIKNMNTISKKIQGLY